MKKETKHKGTLDDISQEQLALVNKMKHELLIPLLEAPELNTTFHILRFLRARDFNYEKAKCMFSDYLSFRKRKDFTRIAKIDQRSPRMEIMRQNYTSGHYGVDFEGRVIIIERVGGYNPHNLFKDFTLDDIEDYLIQLHERMLFIELPITSQLHKKRVENTFLIVDMKHVNVMELFKSKMKSFVKFGTKLGQDYYPEVLSKSVFINSPLIFKAVWAVISIWMDKKTVAKFEFESGSGLKRLAKYLDVTQLPLEIGGQNQVPLTYGFGPWREAIERSFDRYSFFLDNRQAEYDYFYTEEEMKKTQVQSQVNSLIDVTSDSDGFRTPNRKVISIQDIKVSQFRVCLTPRKGKIE